MGNSRKNSLMNKTPLQLRRAVASARHAEKKAREGTALVRLQCKDEIKKANTERDEAIAKLRKFEEALNSFLKTIGR